MPALAKPPVVLPRFAPHQSHAAAPEAPAGAGSFSKTEARATLSDLEMPDQQEDLDHLAHDARNVLSSLMLYCDLLSEPGVLGRGYSHYAAELLGIARTANQIMESMAVSAAHNRKPQSAAAQKQTEQEPSLPAVTAQPLSPVCVTDMAEEVARLHPLLTAIAGPSIQLSVATMPCPGRTALAVEDLTRILINLVRNAADAMPAGGRIRVTAQYGNGQNFADDTAFSAPASVLVAVADNGPGIPAPLREQIFDPGFTTRGNQHNSWPRPRRRGLGLSIVRNLAEAAGGTVRVLPAPVQGSRFEISLPLQDNPAAPVTSGTYELPRNHAFPADHA